MGDDVVSFRPSAEEQVIIEQTRRALHLKTRADAVRALVRKGGERMGRLSADPVFQYRVPPRHRAKRTMSSREIDEALYGGEP
jgi:hypothetical protein